MIDLGILERLNSGNSADRLAALSAVAANTTFPQADDRLVNNHIHTTYSFSPYSPSAAVYAAKSAGLITAGIVDHDSIGGAEEFIEAGRICNIVTTIGVECRVSMAGTGFEKLRTNNPDQVGVSYMVLHGVPHRNISRIQSFFAPLRECRNKRNRDMVVRINKELDINIDFDKDVLPLSQYSNGGTVTERHLMQALARKLSPGLDIIAEYDLIGKLKKEFISKIYIPAVDECPLLRDVVRLAEETGSILAYAYLGDVTASVTGDKKAQSFEDAYLDELFSALDDCGVHAVTYMPTRNTDAQLDRVRALCEAYGFLQISGEDINSPRQSFVIEKMMEPRFSNLIDSTWKIIDNERKA